MAFSTELISLNDGTQIAAPADKKLMTNFVLKEQGDWFEHEIHFVRAFIQPDMHALDIGANYGLYSTAIANNLSDEGHLWCFEPTTNTASALRETISKNELDNKITLIEAGLSDHEGQATFYTSENAELNSLTECASTTGEKLTIDLLTLDNCYAQQGWPKLDFIKLDAEGEEINILKAGEKTLAECSPLIMFELKHGDKVNEALIDAFAGLGYSSYYLIPHLNILVPFDRSQAIDGFMLNLFCCKDDTATQLQEQGFLVSNAVEKKSDSPQAIYSQLSNQNYFKELALDGKEAVNDQLKNVLEAYNHYRNEALSKQERYENLLYAFGIVKQVLSTGESNILALSSYARVAFDIGQRSLGIQICDYIVKKYMQTATPFTIDSPFVPAHAMFEDVPLNGNNPNVWLCCSILDTVVRQNAFSSYFNGNKILPIIDQLAKHNFLQDDLVKRKNLILASATK